MHVNSRPRTLSLLLALFATLAATSGCSRRQEQRAPAMTARVERTLHHDKQVWSLCFSPNGDWLASGGVDGVRIWRVADGALLRALPHPAGVTWVVCSGDGESVATGSYD